MLTSTEFDDLSYIVYPNPTKENLYIEVSYSESHQFEHFKIVIQNTEGKILKERTIKNNHVLTLDVSSLSSGNYFIEILSPENEKIVQTKFIKEK